MFRGNCIKLSRISSFLGKWRCDCATTKHLPTNTLENSSNINHLHGKKKTASDSDTGTINTSSLVPRYYRYNVV